MWLSASGIAYLLPGFGDGARLPNRIRYSSSLCRYTVLVVLVVYRAAYGSCRCCRLYRLSTADRVAALLVLFFATTTFHTRASLAADRLASSRLTHSLFHRSS